MNSMGWNLGGDKFRLAASSLSLSLLILLLFCPLAVLAQHNCDGRGQIEGLVIDENGQPTPNAEVAFLSEECAVTGIEPTATSDTAGKFRLSGVPLGINGVYASKSGAGYPDARFAIYLDDPSTILKVVVRPDETVSNVVVRLAKRAEVVTGKIVDAETLQPILASRITISKPDDAHIMLSIGPDSGGGFRLMVPPRPTKFVISAPGYETWLFSGPGEVSPGVVELKPEQKTDLLVKLRKTRN